MASLHVLMAMGLFQMTSGADCSPYYDITSPIFDRITIKLNEDYYPGKEFVIETRNNSVGNTYIQSARLNGTDLKNNWFYHSDFVKGGKLEIVLGPKPNKRWGTTYPPVGY